MSLLRKQPASFLPVACAAMCGAGLSCAHKSTDRSATRAEYGPSPSLPDPNARESAYNFAVVSGWPPDVRPRVPDGFEISTFAAGMDHPRWAHCLPNGDVLVAESSGKPKPPRSEEEFQKQALMKASGQPRPSADRITLLRDADGDGTAETRHVLLQSLNQPFGMAVVGEFLFVGNTDGVMKFPFTPGQTRIESRGELVLSLPAGGYNNHWTRNLLASPDGRHLYVAVGSASNVAEHGVAEEDRRANILRIDLDGSNEVIYASGLRNPVGMDWEPQTGLLWTAVNERDLIGDALVPDYLAGVREGEFYGWPYSYWGDIVDERVSPQRPELVSRARTPDYALGSHTASLGLAFSDHPEMPAQWRGGAFVAQHGSWNRSEFSGFKVIYVPFRNGRPSGPPVDFATGFLPRPETRVAYGRPVGVAIDARGGIIITDDAGDTVWRVAPR